MRGTAVVRERRTAFAALAAFALFVAVLQVATPSEARRPSTVTVTASVVRDRSGNGTITSDPTGINCGADCTETYAARTSVHFTATPASGSYFIRWSAGPCRRVLGPVCRLTLVGDTVVTAVFSTRAPAA